MVFSMKPRREGPVLRWIACQLCPLLVSRMRCRGDSPQLIPRPAPFGSYRELPEVTEGVARGASIAADGVGGAGATLWQFVC